MTFLYVLLAFICGIVFGLIGIPWISTKADDIYHESELSKSARNIEIAKNNVKVALINEQLSVSNVNAVGFDTGNSDEYEYLEEDIIRKPIKNRKVGFGRW
jgi:capsule polysaccharide export protein KpsE/RkpR